MKHNDSWIIQSFNGSIKSLPLALPNDSNTSDGNYFSATKLKFFYGPPVSFCLKTSQKLLLVIAAVYWQDAG